MLSHAPLLLRLLVALHAVVLIAAVLAAGAPVAAPAGAAEIGVRGQVAGFGVTTSSGGDRAVTLEAERMAAVGANALMLEATWEVDRQDSDLPTATSRTITDDALLAAARRGRDAGLQIMMTVKIVCQGCPGDSARWRGLLRPGDRDVFFENYRVMSNHYAELAEQAGAVLFFVGSEMNSLQGETAEWRRTILEARTRFGGRIGYQVNWDALSGVDFWDDVDVAGVSAYFPLSDRPSPGIADLVASWSSSDTEAHRGTDWTAELERFASEHGKPVLFGEIGYQSAVQAAQRPFLQEKQAGYDAQLQADLYQAALTVFEDRPWWLGVVWWEYKITSATQGDYDYSPRGKLAEELLTRWYAGRRPPTPDVSLVGKTRPPVTATQAPAPLAQAPVPPPASDAATRLPARSVPQALDRVDVQTVEQALGRATERRVTRRASTVASALIACVVLAHAAVALVGARRRTLTG